MYIELDSAASGTSLQIPAFCTFDLDLGVKATQNIAKYPLHAKFEVATSNSLGDAFTRKYIISPLTLGMQSRSHKILPNTLYIM